MDDYKELTQLIFFSAVSIEFLFLHFCHIINSIFKPPFYVTKIYCSDILQKKGKPELPYIQQDGVCREETHPWVMVFTQVMKSCDGRFGMWLSG